MSVHIVRFLDRKGLVFWIGVSLHSFTVCNVHNQPPVLGLHAWIITMWGWIGLDAFDMISLYQNYERIFTLFLLSVTRLVCVLDTYGKGD